jgi:hypothetical protein
MYQLDQRGVEFVLNNRETSVVVLSTSRRFMPPIDLIRSYLLKSRSGLKFSFYFTLLYPESPM